MRWNIVLGLALLSLAACGTSSTGQADAKPPSGAACVTAADCRLFDDYCTGCECRALAVSEPDPKCSGPGVQCILAPCMDRAAACQAGHCAVVPPTR